MSYSITIFSKEQYQGEQATLTQSGNSGWPVKSCMVTGKWTAFCDQDYAGKKHHLIDTDYPNTAAMGMPSGAQSFQLEPDLLP